MLNNLPPDFPFVSNFLLHLTHASFFRVPFMDITDALNYFSCFSGLLFLITAETDWGPKIEPPWQLCRGLTSPIPEVAILILLEQNGSFMTATFLVLPDFRRDTSFPGMVVNTNCNHPRKLGFRTNRGMSQLVLRMLKDAQKGNRILSLSLSLLLSSLLPSFPSHTFLFSVFVSFSISCNLWFMAGSVTHICFQASAYYEDTRQECV